MQNRAKPTSSMTPTVQRSAEAGQQARRDTVPIRDSQAARGSLRGRPSPYRPTDLLALQRTLGNRAVGQIVNAQHRPLRASAAAPGVTAHTASRLVFQSSQSVIQPAREIDPNDEQIGDRVAETINTVNKQNAASDGATGVHHLSEYRSKYGSRHTIEWKNEYENGYANKRYFRKRGFMCWEALPDVRASDAIKAWLKGLTIAECYTVMIAIKLDTIRAAIGDDVFDRTFDKANPLVISTGEPIPHSFHQYKMEATGNPLGHNSKDKDKGKRNVKKGEWYYFRNHRDYLLKHPAGPSQGENVICVEDGNNDKGEVKWSGFGFSGFTELQVLDWLAERYNLPRDDADYKELLKGDPNIPGAIEQYADSQLGEGKTLEEKFTWAYKNIPYFNNYLNREGYLKDFPNISRDDIVNNGGGFDADRASKINVFLLPKSKEPKVDNNTKNNNTGSKTDISGGIRNQDQIELNIGENRGEGNERTVKADLRELKDSKNHKEKKWHHYLKCLVSTCLKRRKR